jgi:hypothetical protein
VLITDTSRPLLKLNSKSLNSEKRKLFEHCPGGQSLDDGTVYNVPEVPLHENDDEEKNFCFKIDRREKQNRETHAATLVGTCKVCSKLLIRLGQDQAVFKDQHVT